MMKRALVWANQEIINGRGPDEINFTLLYEAKVDAKMGSVVFDEVQAGG